METVGSDHGEDGLQGTKEEEGLAPAGLGQNLPQEAALELNLEECLGFFTQRVKKEVLGGRHRQGLGQKGGDGFGDWPGLCLEPGAGCETQRRFVGENVSRSNWHHVAEDLKHQSEEVALHPSTGSSEGPGAPQSSALEGPGLLGPVLWPALNPEQRGAGPGRNSYFI